MAQPQRLLRANKLSVPSRFSTMAGFRVIGEGGAVETPIQPIPRRTPRSEVTATGKNADREIISLCNNAEPWSPRSAVDAIRDIQIGAHVYFVAGPAGPVEVRVVNARTGP